MLITTVHQRCLTSPAVSDKHIPEWLSISYSLQNWGLVCWKATSGVKSRVLFHSSSMLLHTRDVLESKSCQQLDRCLAATVWAARHHSYMHHLLSPWLHENHTSATEPGDTDWNRHAGTCLSETSEERQWAEAASDWNVVSNQQSFIDQAIDQWQDCFNACLKAKSKHWTFAIMFLRNCHDLKAYIRYCCYEQIDLCFVSQGRVRTAVNIGGQFCCSSVANLR